MKRGVYGLLFAVALSPSVVWAGNAANPDAIELEQIRGGEEFREKLIDRNIRR